MSPSQESLVGLLPRIAQGDRAAFRALYDATAGTLFAVGLRMLGDSSRAEDLLQDVYLRVWHRAGDYHPGRGAVTAWLVAIARNRAIDLRRSAFERGERWESDGDPRLAEEPADDAVTPRLDECIDRLEPDQRQSVYTAFFDGLTHSEIAARFREPLGTVKSRIRRGLAALKECLEA